MSEFLLNVNEGARTYLIHKPKSQVIDRFDEYMSFLSNDQPSWIFYEGMLFPSVSVAFQAARAQDQETKEKIQQVDSPEELMELAKDIQDPPEWESTRLKVMEILIRDKFIRSMELRERLRLTEEKQIVQRHEEESPSNLFWGFVGSKGQNWVGRLLEAVRKDIQDKSDTKKWLMVKFPLENDIILLPIIQLKVWKDSQQVETIDLKGKNHYYMGQYKTNSVLLAHPSISRLHACIVCEEGQKVRLIDLESKSGSFVNGEIIEKLQDREIKNGDVLTFALSSRSYEVVIDYKEVGRELQKRQAMRQAQVRQLQKLNQPTITPEELRKIMGFSIDDTLFISGLPDNANPLTIKALFQEFAKVKSVKVPIDKKTGRQKGFAYVLFESVEEFRKAHLRSMNLKLGDRKLKVKIADKEKSQSLMEQCKIDSEDEKEEQWKKRRDGRNRQSEERKKDRYIDSKREYKDEARYKENREHHRSRDERDEDLKRSNKDSEKRKDPKESQNRRDSKEEDDKKKDSKYESRRTQIEEEKVVSEKNEEDKRRDNNSDKRKESLKEEQRRDDKDSDLKRSNKQRDSNYQQSSSRRDNNDERQNRKKDDYQEQQPRRDTKNDYKAKEYKEEYLRDKRTDDKRRDYKDKDDKRDIDEGRDKGVKRGERRNDKDSRDRRDNSDSRDRRDRRDNRDNRDRRDNRDNRDTKDEKERKGNNEVKRDYQEKRRSRERERYQDNERKNRGGDRERERSEKRKRSRTLSKERTKDARIEEKERRQRRSNSNKNERKRSRSLKKEQKQQDDKKSKGQDRNKRIVSSSSSSSLGLRSSESEESSSISPSAE